MSGTPFQLNLSALTDVDDLGVATLAEEFENADDDQQLTHTPRFDDAWFTEEVTAELIEESLRPGHCALRDEPNESTGTRRAKAEAREWMLERLQRCGHAALERGSFLMAQSWFECAYATVRGTSDLLSSANMRLRQGQWALAKELYARVLVMPVLSEAQRAMADRKLEETCILIEKGVRPPQPTSQDESSQLLSSAGAGGAASLIDGAELPKLLQLLRHCAHEANAAHDYASAASWFDGAYSASGSVADLLSAANMRLKLHPTSPVASDVYEEVLRRSGVGARERMVAEQKLNALRAAADGEYELL